MTKLIDMNSTIQSLYDKYFVGKSILLIWATLCVFLFIIYPGSVSYIHWTQLGEWQLLPEKLTRLNLVQDVVSFLESFAGVVIFSFTYISLGTFVTKISKIDVQFNSRTTITRLALLATEFLIGHGIFSLIFLTLSGTNQLTPHYVIALLLAGFLLGASAIKNRFLNTITNMKPHFRDGLGGKLDKVTMWLLVSILFASLLYSSARISYDSTSIYFSNAKLTAIAHQVQFFLDDTFVVSAFQTAIQYTAVILVFGDQSARMLSWCFGTVVIVFSLALGEEVGLSRRARPILLSLTLTSTAFLDLMGDGKVDLMSSAPAIATIYWMMIESKKNNSEVKSLLLIGFLCGLAIVGRPFNAFLLGVFIILFYLQNMLSSPEDNRKSYKSMFISLSWIAISVSVLGLYHLFANWIILGNPLAFVTSVTSINLSTGPWDFNPQRILFVRLFYPFAATYLNTPQSLGNMSPLVVAFLPAILLRDIRETVGISKDLTNLINVCIIALLLWIFLFFSVLEFRYVLFLWIILFIPMAEIISATLTTKDQFFQTALSGLIIVLLVFNVLRISFISLDTYSPIDKHGNPQCSDSSFCEYLRPINQIASPGDRVLTLSAFRYYLRTDLFACSTKHDEYKALQELDDQNMEPFWLEVYRQGYEYIAYENDYTTRHLQFKIIPSPENTPDWIHLEPIFGGTEDLQIAYKINVSNPPIRTDKNCQKNSSGIWEVRSPAP